MLVGRGDEAWVRAWKAEYPDDAVEVIDAAGRAAPDVAERQVQKKVLGRIRGGLIKAVWIALPPTSAWGSGDERDRRSRIVSSATIAFVEHALANGRRGTSIPPYMGAPRPRRDHDGVSSSLCEHRVLCLGQPRAPSREGLLSERRPSFLAQHSFSLRRPAQGQKLDRPLPRACGARHRRLFQKRLCEEEGGRDSPYLERYDQMVSE